MVVSRATEIRRRRRHEPGHHAPERHQLPVAFRSDTRPSESPVKRRPARETKPGGAAALGMPRFIAPQLSLLVDEPPRGPEWVHEIKWDGYPHSYPHREPGGAMLTRTGLDWTGKYQSIAKAARSLEVESAHLDGELCAVRPDGTASFDDLQAASDGRKRANLVHFAFDLLYLEGEDLRRQPLGERKQRLRGLIPASSKLIRYGDHYVGDGEEFFESACHVNVDQARVIGTG